MHSFNSFVVYEPEREKICSYLMEVYHFKQSEELALRLNRYLKTVEPFLDQVMGSQLSLMRKVV